MLSVPYANFAATTGDTSMWQKESEDIFYKKGNVGIGTELPTEKLDISGGLKLVDGTEGVNKVLTSDATGKASWENLNDVNKGYTNPEYPDGTDGITPITEKVNSSTNYTVPTGKNLYILNVLSMNDNNSLEINDNPVTYGYYNYGTGTFSQRLSNPLVATQGDVIDGSDANDITINGYLVGLSSGGGTTPFNCGDILTDIDDNTYNTVQIGTQCWMAENLNVGTMINGGSSQTDNSTIEKYCYSNNTTNCVTYGGLYQWDEMMQYVTTEGTQGICPTGWHLPTNAEWMTLEEEVESTAGVNWNTLGFRGTDAGGNLKETGTTHWNSPNTGATNSSGFTGLPGGQRVAGSFYDLSSRAIFWSSSGDGAENWFRFLHYDDARVGRHHDYQAYGFSVRCVRD
ncbi:MAG: fibrobacter succinogenes major paralogous domain-containing protein [Bacteroidales bacterium]